MDQNDDSHTKQSLTFDIGHHRKGTRIALDIAFGYGDVVR